MKERFPVAGYNWSNHEDTGSSVRPSLSIIRIDDESLRDGLQGAQLEQAITINEKKIYIELAAPLVDHFDLAYPNSHESQYKDALDLVKHGISKGLQTSYSFAGRAAAFEDLKPIIDVFETLGKYPQLRADIFLDGSKHRAKHEGWDREELLSQMEKNIKIMKKQDLMVMFVAERATSTPPEELEETFERAACSGADVLCIADTQGLVSPTAMRNISRWSLDKIGRKYSHILWDAHCHNHLGMAVANSLTAIEEGFNEVHGTVLWMGEGPGNADLANLLTVASVKGYLDKDLTSLKSFYKNVSDLFGLKIPVSAPVVGASAHKTSSSIHARALEKGNELEASLIYNPYYPGIVGDKASTEIGPMSGPANVRLKAKDMGYTSVPPQEMINEALNEARGSGRILPESRMRTIAKKYQLE